MSLGLLLTSTRLLSHHLLANDNSLDSVECALKGVWLGDVFEVTDFWSLQSYFGADPRYIKSLYNPFGITLLPTGEKLPMLGHMELQSQHDAL